MNAVEVFKNELKKIAEEESAFRKALHHPLATAAGSLAPAGMLLAMAHKLYSHFKGGGKWGNLPEVPFGNWAFPVMMSTPLGLLAARKLFPKQETEKTAEMGIIKNPVRPSYPEFRAADPVYRQTPRERPVKAFMLR